MYAELKENHPHGTREYPFCEYHMRYWPHAFQIPVHWHDEVEIIYVRKGPLMVEIDGQKFIGDDGAVYIVSPGVLHMMAAPETPVDYFTFLFPMEFISFQTKDELEDEIFFPLRNHTREFRPEVTNRNLLEKLIPILDELSEKNGKFGTHRQIQVRIRLLQVVDLLVEYDQLEAKTGRASGGLEKEILIYIQDNYHEHISLAELSEHFHLSEKYMSRFFSERFHMTLTQYVNYVRLKYARHLLESTDLSVTEIAMKSGYPNVSYFIRKFSAAVGEPPLRYRNGKAVKDQKNRI
ncbi:AraC family transcriptional regulator [Coprococcus aceti]|uniref:AraC family transcriptional regulator n=1 Tax=Coprococcus aceti TaxID=2981786 RepID=UPI0022E5E86D|nr:AraC family transcriptional regulator [Coprococcus aceti]